MKLPLPPKLNFYNVVGLSDETKTLLDMATARQRNRDLDFILQEALKGWLLREAGRLEVVVH
jgi:hypothetical protein